MQQRLQQSTQQTALFKRARLMLSIEERVNYYLKQQHIDFAVKVVVSDSRLVTLFVSDASRRFMVLQLLPTIRRLIVDQFSELASFECTCSVHPYVM